MASRDRTFLSSAMLAAVIAAIALSACGRKGPLEPPPGAALNAAEAGETPEDVNKPDKPFIGDFLLDR